MNGPRPARRASTNDERGLQDRVDALVERELPLGEGGLDEVLTKIFVFIDDALRRSPGRPM